jgi:hypothetical protein
MSVGVLVIIKGHFWHENGKDEDGEEKKPTQEWAQNKAGVEREDDVRGKE